MRKLSRTLAAAVVAAAVAGGTYAFFGSALVPTADARLKDHPKLEQASRSLVDAREYMMHTPSDFRGHKEAALHAINEALHEVALAAGEHDRRAVIGNSPIKLEHVHERLWTARDRIKEGRQYVFESREGFEGHKEAAIKWMDETIHQLDVILAD